MRIESLIVRGHGLDADISLTPLTILLGPNDSGKSTLLGGLAQATENLLDDDWRPVLGDRYHELDRRDASLVVELDGLGVAGHPDERFFGQLLQYGHVWLDVGFPPRSSRSWVDEPHFYDVDGHGQRGMVELPSEPLSSAALRDTFADQLVGFLEETDPAWSEHRREAWAAVLAFCFSSRRFQLFPHFVLWLCPRAASVPDRVKRHAKVLVERSEEDQSRPIDALAYLGSGDDDPSEIPEWIEGLAEGENDAGATILHFGSLQASQLNLWDVVRVTDDETREIEDRVDDFISERVAPEPRPMIDLDDMVRALDERERVEPDPWLELGRDGWVRLSPAITTLCDDLGRRATELAPRFVSERYKIVIEPLTPSQWVYADGRRVTLSLSRSYAEGDRFEFASVGRGVAVWATYSLIEAMRRIREERRSAEARAAVAEEAAFDGYAEEGEAEEHDGSDDDESEALARKIWAPIDPARRQTIYLFDEPERHLHPLAQDQVAKWIADEVSGGSATAVVATHAVPLMQIPSDRAGFFWLRRDDDGLSRPVQITGDVPGAIIENSEAMGFSSTAEAVVLTRAWLVVEGEHDKRVIEHFFGLELRRSRVGILALRGVNQALALVELSFLSQLGKPLFVLFDSVREAWVHAAEYPAEKGSREEKDVEQIRRLKQEHVDLRFLSFPWPDIICALPETRVVQMLDELHKGRSRLFTGWEQLRKDHDESGQQGEFKPFVFKTLQIPQDANAFVGEILRRSHATDPVPTLRGSMATLLDGLNGPRVEQ